MSIYRGAGGAGDAVADSSSEALLVRELAVEVQVDADAAAASATAASSSASAASTSATNAASSATAAASSATAASTSASNAASSASDAATSEANALQYSSDAADSNTDAENHASSASTSATNAAASASTATTQATNASNSASSASTSATNAASSASSASTSATNASNSATSASGSASSASASASSASTSATNAAASATSASNSATTATTQAGTATTKAGEAATSATNAATSAANALASETAAEGQADTATTAATNASNSASAASTSASNASTSATNAANSATAAAASAASINPSTIAITGGSINGTTVGATTASTGRFSTLEYTGTLTGGTGVVNLGSGQFYKDASGNIGVGVSPSYKLDIAGSNLRSRVADTSTGYGIGQYSNSSGSLFVGKDSAAGTLTGTANAGLVYGTGAYPLVLLTNDTERMRIDSAGNVGIGTSSPDSKLDIGTGNLIVRSGNISGYDNLTLASLAIGTNGTVTDIRSNGTAGIIKLSTASNERMRIDSSGNVGIGTSSPARTLEVNGLGKFLSTVTIGGTAGSTDFVGYFTNQSFANNSNNTTVSLGTLSTQPLIFATNATERMRIDSSGNVGIGTASPSTYGASVKLAVVSTSTAQSWLVGGSAAGSYAFFSNNAQSSASNAFQVGQGWATGSDNIGFVNTNGANPFLIATNGAERMRIDSSGNLLVGTTSGQNAKIAIENGSNWGMSIRRNGTNTAGIKFLNESGTEVGYIFINSNSTTFATTSDYRLKENITPMTGALDLVQQLKPVTYNWKVDGSSGQGFIAHELQTVVPECVTGEKDAVDAEGKPQYQGIDTSFLVATLTKAVQEQQALIQNLTTRLNALEGR